MGLIVVPAAWIVRRGPRLARWGDPYTDSAVIYRAGDIAYIEAWSGDGPTGAEWRALREYLRAVDGLTHVAWERRKDGSIHYVYRRLGDVNG